MLIDLHPGYSLIVFVGLDTRATIRLLDRPSPPGTLGDRKPNRVDSSISYLPGGSVAR